jgi:hypothetical protein
VAHFCVVSRKSCFAFCNAGVLPVELELKEPAGGQRYKPFLFEATQK